MLSSAADGAMTRSIAMRETEELSRIIGDIYDASLDPALWPNAIESVCQYVGAASASLHSQDSISRTTDVLFWWGRESSAAQFFQSYLETYGKLNPIFPGVIFFDLELPVAVPDVLSCEEFVKTRFFREWLAPQSLMDGLFSNLEKGTMSCALFTAMRHAGQGPVDERMRRRFELITPHVRRSMLIGKVIDLHRVEAAALADSLDELVSGMFIVDATGRIVHANRSAHRLIAEADVVRASHGRLTALDPQGSRKLLEVFTAASAGDAAVGKAGIAVPLKARSGERYLAHVLPLTSGARRQAGVCYSAAAAMFIRKAGLDLPSPPEAVASEFKLTPAEVRVLFAVVEIGGVPEVAPVLGIADQTVKSHLHRIFEKNRHQAPGGPGEAGCELCGQTVRRERHRRDHRTGRRVAARRSGYGAPLALWPAARASLGAPLRQPPPVDGCDFLADPCPERLHVGALLALFWIHEVVGATRAQPQLERDDEAPRAQIVVSQHVVGQQHSRTFDRGIESVIGAGEAQAPAHVHAVQSCGLEPVGPGGHRGALRERVIVDQRHAR
jgi:DNA-binding CsgD family transcriptional regulator